MLNCVKFSLSNINRYCWEYVLFLISFIISWTEIKNQENELQNAEKCLLQ